MPALKALLREHEVVAVVTQPDRPKNRGHRFEPSPVKVAALAHAIPVLTPEKIRESVEEIPYADAYVVVAYGQVFPQTLLEKPKYGCFNIHASLLPKYRGAAPMQRAIEAGEKVSGVGIMQMDVGLDTGDVLAEESVNIEAMNISMLHDALSEKGAALMAQVLRDVENDCLSPRKQDDSKASYAKMIGKHDYEFSSDWTIKQVVCKIRAYQYIRTEYGGRRVKIFAVDAAGAGKGHSNTEKMGDTPLTVKDGALWLNAADGRIEVTQLQPENGKRMPASAFLNGLR